MSNDTNMRFSLESQEDLSFKSGPLLSDDDFKFNSLNPYQYTDNEVKIKSISANGTPLEPDENKNVDIPRASRNGDGLMSSNSFTFVSQLRTVSTVGSAFAINPAYSSATADENGAITITLLNNTTYIVDTSETYNSIALSFASFATGNNDNGYVDADKVLYMANAEIIFLTPNTVTTFSYPTGLNFVGLDVEDGVFVPQPNMKYDIVISFCQRTTTSNLLIAYVSGYEVS